MSAKVKAFVLISSQLQGHEMAAAESSYEKPSRCFVDTEGRRRVG
jgi:hypothetical protein